MRKEYQMNRQVRSLQARLRRQERQQLQILQLLEKAEVPQEVLQKRWQQEEMLREVQVQEGIQRLTQAVETNRLDMSPIGRLRRLA